MAAYLMGESYEVYLPLGGKTSCDLIALKHGHLHRVEVKSTATKRPSGNWAVMLKSVRHNRTQNKIKLFNADACDMLAVWVAPLDRVVLIEPQTVHGKGETTILGETIR